MGTVSVTIADGWIEGMTTLELVAWLRGREYDGPVDFPRGRLIELMLEILRPVDWSVPVPVAAEPVPDWQAHEVKDHWMVLTEWEGVTRATDIQVDGETGWFHFDRITCNTSSGRMWLDCWGGPKGNEMFRAFSLDRVKRNRKTGRIVTRVHVSRKDKD